MESYDDNLGGNETQRPEASTLKRDELIGTTLDNRYLIERRLGQGGFGVVYVASDNKTASRKVVVKIMRPEEVGNEWSKHKFEQEVEALSRLDHPGIVGLFDCGETPDGRPYIVMQYIDGHSLRSLLRAEGMPVAQVAGIVRQVGNALTAAHEAGILHRDLKPENIMVKVTNEEEHARVIDFGVAKVKNSIVNVNTVKGMTLGTIIYMSPEQLDGRPLGPQSDIYALGVIAYEMLTGRRPANPDSALHLLQLQRAGIRVKPTALRPALPEAVDDVVVKALSFEPQHRYQNAREFGDKLGAVLLTQDRAELNEPTPEVSGNQDLTTAHVLFMDIVGYAKLLIDEQTRQLKKLQEIVLATSECSRVRRPGDLIRLPTGDGLALVFFTDPEAPVRAAVEISRALKETEIALRMGIHSGLVHRIADINTNLNVAGGGINIAQRVMDCGDNGHILLSKRVADDLAQLARWSEYLDDLGEAEVKHGVRVHLFNLHGSDFGNAELPTKLRKLPKQRSYKKAAAWIVALLSAVGLMAGLWYWQTVATTERPGTVAAEVSLPRELVYWLVMQRRENKTPIGAPVQSAGAVPYKKDWAFQFNVQPAEAGALYLLNAGQGKNGAGSFNILYPIPAAGKINPNLAANQTVQTGWLQFMDETAEEEIWIIWSTKSLPDVNAVFGSAAENGGTITDAEQVARIQNYLRQYDPSKLKVEIDQSKQLTSIKGHGELVIGLLKLSHAAK
ncbi:MAG TPA: protein kinase [Pyrinomonadaceae bacterium]